MNDGHKVRSFEFDLSWYEIMSGYDEAVRLEVYEGIMEYAQSGTLTQQGPLASMALAFITRQMNDRTRQQARAGSDPCQDGYTPTAPSDDSASRACAIESDINKKKFIDRIERVEEDKEGCGEKKEKPKRMTRPTPDEVNEYVATLSATQYCDGAAFCDFYASNGWKVGSNPMKDWRAAVRNWISRHKKELNSNRNETQYRTNTGNRRPSDGAVVNAEDYALEI